MKGVKMDNEVRFKAPWGVMLAGMTLFSCVLLVGIAVIGLTTGPRESVWWLLGMVVMPLTILFVSMLFVIRGFVITDDMLIVQRLGWNTRLSLTDFVSARVDPEAIKRSIRLFGNGGMFCFTGTFRNKHLGTYRAFANDMSRSVVLKFTDRTVVVTPDRPDEFAARLNSRREGSGV